jgi:hypothetical protein
MHNYYASIKKYILARHQRLTPIILSTQEAEIRGQSQTQANSS